ncbi:MAG TPA: GntR family transcriptional regulator [Solirubrobacterales bacterium]|nr:GntR family transcriptional regulator [Solirubrobacterales bacterium]
MRNDPQGGGDVGLPSSPRPLSRGPVPLHHQLYLELRSSLDRGVWGVGDQLPTEKELAERYGCSLITVRRALDELRRERRIERIPGRGSFVTAAPIERDLAALTSFTQEMEARGLSPETTLIGARSGKADAQVGEYLELEPGTATIEIERLRSAGGQPLVLETVHLPAARFPGLLETDLAHESLYELLAERYGVTLVRAREAIEPILPSKHEAELLEQNARRPALLIELVAFTGDGVPIEFCRGVVRGDRARYYVDADGPRIDAWGGLQGKQPNPGE